MEIPVLSAVEIHRRDQFFFFFSLAVLFALASVVLLFGGCATPFYATDNPVLLRLPGAERKSDQIQGVLRPWERMELIEEKGEKGKNASQEHKKILIEQLTEEFEQTQSPNIRRACVDAIANIGSTTPSTQIESVFAKAIYNDNLGVQLSAVNGYGRYCTELKEKLPQARKIAAEKLALRFHELPYSVEAGSHQENSRRKDIRLSILRNLELFSMEDSPSVLTALDEALRGEKLDDGSLQNAAMRTLQKVSGKNYGYDARQWAEYIDFVQNKTSNAPKELSAFERIPKPDMPMFK